MRLIVRETAFDAIFGFSQGDITVQMWHVFKYEFEVEPSTKKLQYPQYSLQ